ncbi:MAG: aminoacyl-tRNA deacylase, partial [Chloroflexi bacterium]
MATKLNTMRVLEQHNIPYEAISYPNTIRDAEEVAEVIGLPPYMVYKTLVVLPVGENKPLLAMLPADRRLDLKTLAKVAGHKKVQMA